MQLGAVILGGFLGVVVMRFAATLFIWLLEKFPQFEVAAYLLAIAGYFSRNFAPGSFRAAETA